MAAKNALVTAPPHALEQALERLGANLRLARVRRGLTLKQVAEKIGTGVRAVADAEKGKPTTSIAVYGALLWLFGLMAEFELLADPARPSVAPIPMSESLVRYAGLRNTGLSLPSPGLNPRARQAHRRLVARIRELADAAGFPVTHLPDRAGVSRSHFWDVMGLRRSPTVVWLHSVAEALDVELSALFPPEE